MDDGGWEDGWETGRVFGRERSCSLLGRHRAGKRASTRIYLTFFDGDMCSG